jgi:D-aminopeptidase
MTRARDLDLACGDLLPGARNMITDVPGVRVGHTTIIRDEIRTGVTSIVPHDGNMFLDKPVAASFVLNGFGQSVGLIYLDELGALETPILLTNTLSVGACANALVRRAIEQTPAIGRRTGTVHPVVCECSDFYLNDIQAMAITEADALAALDAAEADFAVGAVGAGTGMSCFGLKGGIGSASRMLEIGGQSFHLGALVLANFGRAGDLRLPDGRRIDPRGDAVPEAGSVIVVLATDIPLESRQLQRVARRAGVGLARCGSFWGHGSGDVFLAFTTANRVAQMPENDFGTRRVLAESRIDLLFQAAAEATQEAVLDALAAADAMTGFRSHHRRALREVI